jgi:hypothetical protein
MNKLLAIGAAAAALAAAPAAAQYGQGGNGQYGANVNAGGAVGIQNRIQQFEARLQAGIQSGAISRTEEQSLRSQLRDLRRLERQYSMNGLSQQERFDLQQRIRYLRQQFRTADGGGRNNQYGGWDRDDDYNQGGYGQGSYGNQGGYGQGGYYGQGGPYQEEGVACQPRSGGGLGGVIGSIFGNRSSGDEDCGLRVGQRVTGGLYSLPGNMQYQYRDGNGIYHRTDGRYVYQIDARTNTVVRVYSTR